MAKTVAKRATELGTDKRELVRALKILSRYHIVNGKVQRQSTRWGGYWYRPKVPLLSHAQACEFLDLDPKDAKQEIDWSYPIPWNRDRILDGLFLFLKEHGRWPLSKELRNANKLPSPGIYRWTAWRRQTGGNRVSPNDWWQVQVAADRRCTPELALGLRNVLARKTALDRIGFQTFIKKGVAELIAEDPEFGALYRLPGEMPSESMVLLKVINSTAEEDGSFTDYYLRVPPEMTDVREALKWTFNGNKALGAMPYAPLIET